MGVNASTRLAVEIKVRGMRRSTTLIPKALFSGAQTPTTVTQSSTWLRLETTTSTTGFIRTQKFLSSLKLPTLPSPLLTRQQVQLLGLPPSRISHRDNEAWLTTSISTYGRSGSKTLSASTNSPRSTLSGSRILSREASLALNTSLTSSNKYSRQFTHLYPTWSAFSFLSAAMPMRKILNIASNHSPNTLNNSQSRTANTWPPFVEFTKTLKSSSPPALRLSLSLRCDLLNKRTMMILPTSLILNLKPSLSPMASTLLLNLLPTKTSTTKLLLLKSRTKP